jgi:DNA-binding PadR family transcriptional regulator
VSLKYAILGLLERGPKTGYEIKVYFRDTIKNFWNVSDGQLYPTLRNLCEEGLITRQQSEEEGGVSRNLYEITETGRKEFLEWLQTSERTIPELKEPFLLKLLFFDLLTPQESARQIDIQIRHTEDALEEYREVRTQYKSGVTSYQRTVLDLGIILLEGRLLFLKKLKEMILKGRLTRHEPLFTDEAIELGKEIARQLLEVLDEGKISFEEFMGFTRGLHPRPKGE